MAGSGFRLRPAAVVSVLLFAWTLLVAPAAQAAPPANDNFAGRTVISGLPYVEPNDTSEATTEPGEPDPRCAPIGRTVWYQFTPSSDMVLGAAALDAEFEAVLAVWTGGGLGSLSQVACSSFYPVVFAANAGTTYMIQVGAYAGDDGGPFTFRLRQVDAGVISGIVTDERTGAPLDDICVDVVDADLFFFSTVVTEEDGTYEVPVRQGTYIVFFYDFCDESNDHKNEFFDGKTDLGSANEVVVNAPGTVPNINASLQPACPGYGGVLVPHLIGTEAPDTLVGGTVREVICGFGGNDRINGSGGSDIIIAHAGRDRVAGGDGGDRISGGDGLDRLAGGGDRDRIFGDAADDELSGGSDNDYLEGENGADLLRGSGGDDHLEGERGSDTLHGGSGKDVCDGDRGRDEAGPTCERVQEVP